MTMTTKLRPYVPTATLIEGPWPARAAKCRDDYSQKISVVDSWCLAALLADTTPDDVLQGERWSAPDPVETAFSRATSATLYLRHTSAMAYCVALVTPWDDEVGYYYGSTEAYYGSGGGYGYDRTAAAMHGIPVGLAFAPDGKRHRVILTDHCGLGMLDHPWRENKHGPSAFMAHRNGNLPRGLFTQ